MTLLKRAAVVFACLFAATTLTFAQASKPATDATSKNLTSNKAAVSAAAERAARERRATAVSLLVTLADDVRNFTDQKLRARTQARIADALWDADPDQGRTLFRKAWDAAELADQDSARRLEEERQRQQAATGNVALIRPTNLRLEVLRLAAKRDRALGEELLDKLKEAKKQEADAITPAAPGAVDTPAATRQRLQLANQLLENDVERALQFADPVLGTVTMEGLNFLSFLRDKNPAAADQRYSRMLTNAEADLQSDANTVSLLSSYLFTPHMFVMFQRDGGQATSQMNQRTPPPEVSPELRAAYLRIAAAILLRPLPPPEQDRSSSGIPGKFLVIRRMLPLFEQYAPKATVDQLRGEMASLGQGVDRDVADNDDDDGLRRGITPDQNPADREKSLLDRIDRARTPAERNAIYLQLATMNASKGDLRARDFVEKIDDSEMRNKVRPFIDMTLAMNVVEKKDTEKTLSIARTGELTHIERTWVLTQAVKLMPKSEREKALEIIAEAAGEARRIEPSDPDRPRALIAVANALMTFDGPRGWEALPEIAKAANSADDFTGEDGRLVVRLQTPNMTSIRTSGVDDFNLTGLFHTLTQENYTEAVQLARNFEGQAPRAAAMISIARTILSEKQK